VGLRADPSGMGNRQKRKKKSFFSFLHVPRLGGVRGQITGSAFGTDPYADLDLELV